MTSPLMHKKKVILYFTYGYNPAPCEIEEATKVGATAFRNAYFDDGQSVEHCHAVAGKVPAQYADEAAKRLGIEIIPSSIKKEMIYPTPEKASVPAAAVAPAQQKR